MRILVVESHGRAAPGLSRALGALSIRRVTRVQDVGAGLDLLRAAPRKIDVVVFELDADGIDGIEFMLHAAGQKGLAFILISSQREELHASVNALARHHRLNLLGVLPRPVPAFQLQSLLSGHVPFFMVPENPGKRSGFQCARDDIARGLANKQFIPFFQPQIELSTGRVVSVEVLARWNHPELGLLPPSQFIGIMEQSGLIDRLFESLLNQSLEFARMWDTRGWKIDLAINVSPSTLENTDVPNHISELVGRHGFEAGRVTLELTETVKIKETARLLETAIRLRLRGFKLSVDDFGAGYSSLQQLSDIPFTEIKIDRSLVAGIRGSKKSIAILESIVGLADKLGMCTVAEGIESPADRDLILSLGCRFGQAYYFAKPMGNPELIRHLYREGQLCRPVTPRRQSVLESR